MWPISKPTSNRRWRRPRNSHHEPTIMENPTPPAAHREESTDSPVGRRRTSRRPACRRRRHPAARTSVRPTIAQTFLSAVSRAFLPAGRRDESDVRFIRGAGPTGKSAVRQTRMSALRRVRFQTRSADFPVCRFAGLPSRRSPEGFQRRLVQPLDDWKVGAAFSPNAYPRPPAVAASSSSKTQTVPAPARFFRRRFL